MINGPADTLKRAKRMRREMTLPEVQLWRELRKRPGGFKFRRQHPAGVYVLDFFCAAARLAIEVDGWAHDNARSAKADAARSHFLRSQGIATTRVPATVVLDTLDAAVVRIVEICDQRVQQTSGAPRVPLHHASHGPPPRSGEDLRGAALNPPPSGEGDHPQGGGGARAMAPYGEASSDPPPGEAP